LSSAEITPRHAAGDAVPDLCSLRAAGLNLSKRKGVSDVAGLNLESEKKKHPPTSFFCLYFRPVFVIAFSGLSQQVEFKTTKKPF
jgi:hypothetical protein